MEDRAPSAAAEGSVRIGAYSLEVDRLGSFARFEPDEERKNARELAAALDQEPDDRPAVVAAIEDFQESADVVTSRVEQADKLLRDAASGKLLDIGNISGEVAALLDLCARLDSEGRFEEELRLMRSLNGMLALSLRWLELIRSLRRLLRSAEAAGHAPAQAFAQHELGSLNLCAGRARAAVDHLERASELESQIGDVAGSCSTRHNLDAARRDLALRSGPWFRRPRGIQRLVILAGALAIAGGGGAGIALAIQDDGKGSGGSGSEATLIVQKDFTPNAPSSSAEVTVTCTKGGRPDERQKRVTEATPADFTITRFGQGATCTATENQTPSGYSQNNANCQHVRIAPGSSLRCTIANTRGGSTSALFTVSKDFSDDSSAKVSIELSCDSGAISETPIGAAEGSPATFRITGFQEGATCTASEGKAPDSYTADDSNCRGVAISRGSCTIVDTLNTATLTVRKEFTDGSTRAVGVNLSCTSGTIDDPEQPASPSSPAVFTITGFVEGVTCSATEEHLPSSYDGDVSDCQNVPVVSQGECTIVNSPVGATG